MNNTWITADTHFGHGNILAFANRPFRDANHMDEEMIRAWNAKVKEGDTVYHLGDFCMSRQPEHYYNQLNGTIVFVRGNHDWWMKEYPMMASINWKGETITLCHYAMRRWPTKWHAFGHTHGTLKGLAGSMDVGVDNIKGDYAPILIEDFLRRVR